MVKEGKASSVFPIAFGAFCAYYGACLLKPDAWSSFGLFLIFAGCIAAGSAFTPCSKKFGFFTLAMIGAAAGICAFQSRQIGERVPLSLAPVSGVTVLEGVLAGDPVPYGEGRSRFPVSAVAFRTASGDRFSASGKTNVILPGSFARGNYPGRLTLPGEAVLGTGLVTEFPGAFIADRRTGTLYFRAESWNGEGSWKTGIDRFRASLRIGLIESLLARGDSGGLFLALFSGNREYLEDGLAPAFRNAGLSHILALSGMHLSIIGLLIIRFGRGLGHNRLSVRLSLIAMVFFVWFAGPSPSLFRAVLMAAILFVSKSLGYKASSLAVLALTAIIQLLLFPADAISPAFALSYGALAGILAFSEPLSSLLPGRLPPGLRSALTASIGAQLATAAYTAAAFGTFVPLASLASILVGPLAAFYLSSGMLWLALYAVSPTMGLTVYPLIETQYALIERTVRGFAGFNPLEIRDLSGILLAGIISFAFAACVLAANNVSRKGRFPDAGFAGL